MLICEVVGSKLRLLLVIVRLLVASCVCCLSVVKFLLGNCEVVSSEFEVVGSEL